LPELRKISGTKAIIALERLGFSKVRQKRSHVVLRKDTLEGPIGCVVPLHKELKIGTLRGILKQAKIEIEEFSKLL